MKMLLGGVAALLGLFLVTGCDDDEFDRNPPAGQGSLVVDNRTSDRIDVYIDGARMANVRSGKHRYYDLDPGTYRVVLNDDDARRSYADDVDILIDRLTVMDVTLSVTDFRRFDVFIYFE
jgi:hypothetical protein